MWTAEAKADAVAYGKSIKPSNDQPNITVRVNGAWRRLELLEKPKPIIIWPDRASILYLAHSTLVNKDFLYIKVKNSKSWWSDYSFYIVSEENKGLQEYETDPNKLTLFITTKWNSGMQLVKDLLLPPHDDIEVRVKLLLKVRDLLKETATPILEFLRLTIRDMHNRADANEKIAIETAIISGANDQQDKETRLRRFGIFSA
jgi:hypothetical protein